MKKINPIETVSKFNDLLNQSTLHPLVSLIDFSQNKFMGKQAVSFGFYAIFFKEYPHCELKYDGKFMIAKGNPGLYCAGQVEY